MHFCNPYLSDCSQSKINSSGLTAKGRLRQCLDWSHRKGLVVIVIISISLSSSNWKLSPVLTSNFTCAELNSHFSQLKQLNTALDSNVESNSVEFNSIRVNIPSLLSDSLLFPTWRTTTLLGESMRTLFVLCIILFVTAEDAG